MTRTGFYQRSAAFTPVLTTLAAGVLMAVCSSQTATAVEFSTDNWEGNFDSTFSYGTSYRMEERDSSKIGKGNGGTAWSNNNDDGDLNFDNHEAFSRLLKGLHEFDLHRKDRAYGLFTRASYFYDFKLMDGTTHFKELGDAEQSKQGKGASFLDTYVWANWEPFNTRLQVRAGEQVFNWGESTLIGHGLSEVNAVDLGKLRVPGAELKEAYIPAKALWGSWQLSGSVGLEAFAQFEWQPVRFDAPGTYLSTQDYIGDTRINETALHTVDNSDGTQTITEVPSPCNGAFGMVHLLFGQVAENTDSTQACRTADHKASDHGQYGVKLSWYSQALGDTDFSLYYVNYHNKRPIISADAYNVGIAPVQGFLEYLEDIRMQGLSFNTTLNMGLSIAGEVTRRENEPLQVDDAELLFAALQSSPAIPSGTSQLGSGFKGGEEISGYRLFNTYQAQVTFTQLFQNIMGAEQFTMLAEVGMDRIPDLPSEDELRFEVNGTHRSGNKNRAGNGIGYAAGNLPFDVDGDGVPDTNRGSDLNGDGIADTGCVQAIGSDLRQCEGVETNHFATKNSWGYRLIGRWEYSNAFKGVNMTPRIVFQHDVSGYTPAPISNFIAGRKSATVGVAFDYLNRWRLDVSYATFFGNDAQDALSDRDFISAFISYSI